MPHARKRHIIDLILKKLSFTPAVAIQGARQTGKSFIGRELLPPLLTQTHYISLDEKALRTAAQNSPDDFLQRYPMSNPLIIDEVQKAPDLFDALKLNIDKNRTPGKYILLGSTEFSRLTKVRESLTGRMSRVRVFPFNLAESISLSENPSKKPHLLNPKPRVARSDIHLYLQKGGLPGLFSVRSSLEHEQLITDLLDLILFRDARFAKWFDPELGRDILEQIARLEIPNLSEISNFLKTDTRRIKRHIEVLQELFVIHRIEPHRLGFGKDRYFIYDCAIAKFLGASEPRVIQTWFLNEQMSQRTCRGELKWKISTYSTQKNSLIDYLIESNSETYAVKIFDQANIRKTDVLVLKSLQKKSPDIQLIGLGPFSEHYEENEISFFPYESMV